MPHELPQVDALKAAFASHPRQWRDNLYVYPVISRRARGLSIGVNLNPDTACNFDCIYCCVDRTKPPRVRKVDLDILGRELRELVAAREALFEQPEFAHIPAEYRRLSDIAFSGDGEPTASPVFAEAARLACDVRQELGVTHAKIVIITDACFLTRPRVAETLDMLDAHGLEIWAKLDAGAEDYFRRVARPSHSLEHVLNNIRAAAQRRAVVIQSLFMRIDDQPPPPAEIAAYADRLRELRDAGAQLKLVQIYTVARQTAEAYVAPLTAEELNEIAAHVRAQGIAAETYP